MSGKDWGSSFSSTDNSTKTKMESPGPISMSRTEGPTSPSTFILKTDSLPPYSIKSVLTASLSGFTTTSCLFTESGIRGMFDVKTVSKKMVSDRNVRLASDPV